MCVCINTNISIKSFDTQSYGAAAVLEPHDHLAVPLGHSNNLKPSIYSAFHAEFEFGLRFRFSSFQDRFKAKTMLYKKNRVWPNRMIFGNHKLHVPG